MRYRKWSESDRDEDFHAAEEPLKAEDAGSAGQWLRGLGGVTL
jgi:hypothetical protein